MGLGKGISMNNGPTYIAEIAPAKVRGVMLSLWQRKSRSPGLARLGAIVADRIRGDR